MSAQTNNDQPILGKAELIKMSEKSPPESTPSAISYPAACLIEGIKLTCMGTDYVSMENGVVYDDPLVRRS